MANQNDHQPGRKTVVVCGGRSYADREVVYRVLDKVAPDVVVHGACGVDADDGAPDCRRMHGADRLADDWALSRLPAFPRRRAAAWKRLGKKAGPIRNQQMADEFPTAEVIAFPGGKGTANMISIAHKAGMTVCLVTMEGVLL